jgi:proteasome lid subunit RPN8/RPN11
VVYQSREDIIRISRAALEEIAAHARHAAPEECCGFLLGTTGLIAQAIPSANLASDRTRQFLIDSRTHFDLIRRARAGGVPPIVGFYHSHPFSEPAPSAADLAGAAYAEHWFLIVRPDAGAGEARIFRFDGLRFVEAGLVVDG